MPPTSGRLLMTVPEAARLSGLSPKRLYELSSRPGAIPAGVVIRIGRSVRISRSRFLAWIGEPNDRDTGSQDTEDDD
jgi:predicted DNA-binding transcriptional regulator AlpA